MATSTSVSIKQGATLQLMIAATNDDGSPFDLAGVTVAADVRRLNTTPLIASLKLQTTSVVGQLLVSQDTTTWAPAAYVCDFSFAKGDIVLKSATLTILVVTAVTL